jgi:hypothetical protein
MQDYFIPGESDGDRRARWDREDQAQREERRQRMAGEAWRSLIPEEKNDKEDTNWRWYGDLPRSRASTTEIWIALAIIIALNVGVIIGAKLCH